MNTRVTGHASTFTVYKLYKRTVYKPVFNSFSIFQPGMVNSTVTLGNPIQPLFYFFLSYVLPVFTEKDSDSQLGR